MRHSPDAKANSAIACNTMQWNWLSLPVYGHSAGCFLLVPLLGGTSSKVLKKLHILLLDRYTFTFLVGILPYSNELLGVGPVKKHPVESRDTLHLKSTSVHMGPTWSTLVHMGSIG